MDVRLGQLARRWPGATRSRPKARLAVLTMSEPANPSELMTADGSPADGDDWREVTLIGDGSTPMADGSAIELDADAAADVITEIGRRGIDIIVDRDHATVRGGQNGAAAPAMGWIDHKSVKYLPGRGLIGRVKWTAEGAGYVHGGGYRYTSPTILFEKSSGRVRRLHSLALTNVPLTLHAQALKAASGSGRS